MRGSVSASRIVFHLCFPGFGVYGECIAFNICGIPDISWSIVVRHRGGKSRLCCCSRGVQLILSSLEMGSGILLYGETIVEESVVLNLAILT